MATCPECEFDEIDTTDQEEGDELSCPECGKMLVVAGSDDLEVAGDDDEDEDDDEDDDLEDDDEDEGEDVEGDEDEGVLDEDDLDSRGRVTVAASADSLASRERRLHDLVASYDSVIVAFSGGADSAYLAWVATQLLGPAALCITADSPSYPDHHRQLAVRVAREFGLRHEFVQTSEIDRPEYRANPVDRCYYCKTELYDVLWRASRPAAASPRYSTVATPTTAATIGRGARRRGSSVSGVHSTRPN